jgi:hypothetical protein
MADDSKRNLLYFESDSMRELYESMEIWQTRNLKRLCATQIQKDGDKFCCIASTSPVEVVICNGSGPIQAEVARGCLFVEKVF